MKKFNFNLQKVLVVRQLEEEIAHNHFLKSKQHENRVEQELLHLNDRQQELYNYLRKEDKLDINEKLMARDFMYRQRQNIQKTQENLAQVREEVRKKQAELRERAKKRKVLEKVKEKEYEKFYRGFLLREQKELDEIGQRVSS